MQSIPGKVLVEDVEGATYEMELWLTLDGWKNEAKIKEQAEVLLRMKYRNENDIVSVTRL